MTEAETVVQNAIESGRKIEDLVIDINPPIQAWENGENESSYAEFEDGSWIDWSEVTNANVLTG